MKRLSITCALLLVSVGLLATAATAAPVARTASTRLPSLEGEVLAQLNKTRVERGLRPLVASDSLQSASVLHSTAMLTGGFFQHESADGSPFSDRVKRFYPVAGFQTWTVGENLLYSSGEITAEAVIQAWLDSPGHRRNLLSPAWREVGVGAFEAASAGGTFGGSQTLVVTMDFGARSGGTSVAAATKHVKKKRVQRVLPLPSTS